MRWKSHVRCGAGEKLEIISKTYLSLFDCVLWDNVAANTVKHCQKGDIISVRGRLQSRIYEKDGETHYITEIIGEKVSFISSNSSKKQENVEETEEVE